jgi:hypothetical protein
VHTLIDMAPITEEAVPSAHEVQEPAPYDAEYRPTMHWRHADAAAAEYLPIVHVWHDDRPAEDHIPAAHAEHDGLAATAEKRPGPQLVHPIEPAAEVLPAEHISQLLAPVFGEKDMLGMHTDPLHTEYTQCQARHFGSRRDMASMTWRRQRSSCPRGKAGSSAG